MLWFSPPPAGLAPGNLPEAGPECRDERHAVDALLVRNWSVVERS